MNSDRDEVNDHTKTIEQQEFPVQLAYTPYNQGYSPGAIRNTLGSGLKASGFFEKDGQIKNMRGGFIGNKQPPVQSVPHQNAPYGATPTGYMSQPPNGYRPDLMYQQGGYQQASGHQGYLPGQARQLILEAAQEGIIGNGVATITPDNGFVLIANLPSPQMFLAPGQTGVYAAYLVDGKGRTGFLAGVLKPVGNGVYRALFQSPVPLHHYSRAVVSVENPAQIGPVPNGPIILKVKEPMGMMTFLVPMKNTAKTVWGKISGLIDGRKKSVPSAEGLPTNQEYPPPLAEPRSSLNHGVAPPASIPPQQME